MWTNNNIKGKIERDQIEVNGYEHIDSNMFFSNN